MTERIAAARAAVAPELLERLAELAVRVGMNLQSGQVVAVASEVGKEDLTRRVARAAYRAGAKFVDVVYFDPYVKRARIEFAADETLDYVPPWYGARMLALGDAHAARVALTGPSSVGLLSDLDPTRAGRDRLPWLAEINELINQRSTNWSIVPCPSVAWAQLVHPGLDDADALARLSDEIAYVCRLDAADPLAAWRERMDALEAAADRLTARRFNALHFEGPDTDLTVGLFESARWATARFETADGIPHIANLPSEEVFTSPDPVRTEGVVRSTKPLVFEDGAIIRGLRMRFDRGRVVEIDADEGADFMRTRCSTDDGAARLGEVALVDRQGRIGELETVFYDTLLDENAASHIAVGNGFDFILDEADAARRNFSAIHTDFMIGGDDVSVTGLTRTGERVPVLREGSWQI